MTPAPVSPVQPGQVWEHRHPCRLCKTGTEHRHRYLIISVDPDAARAIVRDLSAVSTKLEPYQRYARPLAVFGSLDKGGLRLCGHWTRHRFAPLPDNELDTRLVEHERVPLRGTIVNQPIPGTAGERLAA